MRGHGSRDVLVFSRKCVMRGHESRDVYLTVHAGQHLSANMKE